MIEKTKTPGRTNQRRDRTPSKTAYDQNEVARYWDRRLKSTDRLAAVLTYNAPAALNKAYDLWERTVLSDYFRDGSRRKQPLKDIQAVDIGCGTGRIATTVASLGADVVAIDISRDMLQECRRTARRCRVESRLSLVRSSATQIPVGSAIYDLVTIFGLLEHLPKGIRQKVIKEALRIVTCRGKVIGIVNNENNLFLRERYASQSRKVRGYFSCLVGLKWLRNTCDKYGAEVRVFASNPFYGLLHYQFEQSIGERKLPRSARLLREAVDYDRETDPNSSLSGLLASHFMVEITRQ